MTDLESRRPLKAKDAAWTRTAAGLARTGVTSDMVLGIGLMLAGLGAAFLALAGSLGPVPRAASLIIVLACIQGRLICNRLGGMVAAERGGGSALRPIWAELPDRVSDALLLAAAGYMLFGLGWRIGPSLGWIAALLAVIAAYVRQLGRGLGFPADFTGPMAKPQRMAALTIGCGLSVLEPLWNGADQMMLIILSVIVVGTAWTIARRVGNLAAVLKAKG